MWSSPSYSGREDTPPQRPATWLDHGDAQCWPLPSPSRSLALVVHCLEHIHHACRHSCHTAWSHSGNCLAHRRYHPNESSPRQSTLRVALETRLDAIPVTGYGTSLNRLKYVRRCSQPAGTDLRAVPANSTIRECHQHDSPARAISQALLKHPPRCFRRRRVALALTSPFIPAAASVL